MNDNNARIKQYIWHKDFSRELEKDLVDRMLSPHSFDEYLGRNIRSLEPNYLRTIIRLFVAMLLNTFMDKVIDAVLEAQEEFK